MRLHRFFASFIWQKSWDFGPWFSASGPQWRLIRTTRRNNSGRFTIRAASKLAARLWRKLSTPLAPLLGKELGPNSDSTSILPEKPVLEWQALQCKVQVTTCFKFLTSGDTVRLPKRLCGKSPMTSSPASTRSICKIQDARYWTVCTVYTVLNITSRMNETENKIKQVVSWFKHDWNCLCQIVLLCVFVLLCQRR